ncbi:MAG TPA: radical SAM protein [Negativicutes bacterium]|nr:radical SAM protein [Negativicutes bacterium]
MFSAVYADSQGNIYDAPGYGAVGRSGREDAVLSAEDLIPLPPGADLMFLPGRSALAATDGAVAPIAAPLAAVAAMLPAGYTRTHLPAYQVQEGAPPLPLYGYTAVAMRRGHFYAAAVRSDDNARWDPRRYNTPDLADRIAAVRLALPGNRLVEHLARCSLEWHCCTAQNLFYHRWEAGIPVSPACNADCLGCISRQPAECCPSPQSRIAFVPSVDEVAAIGMYHLSGAPQPIISFGQGCEGEPSLEAATIAAAVRSIRAKTRRGTVNINTNAGFTAGIGEIAAAGLDSMRVSVISARPEGHRAYYRSGYTLEDVRASIALAKAHGVHVSLNMLLLPGFNDRPEEAAAWEEFVAATGVDMIQLRNLNIDPESVWPLLPSQGAAPLGVRAFLRRLAELFPAVRLGSFSRYIGKDKA